MRVGLWCRPGAAAPLAVHSHRQVEDIGGALLQHLLTDRGLLAELAMLRDVFLLASPAMQVGQAWGVVAAGARMQGHPCCKTLGLHVVCRAIPGSCFVWDGRVWTHVGSYGSYSVRM